MLVQMTIIYLFISFVLMTHMIKKKYNGRNKNNKRKDNIIQIQIDDDVDIEIDPSSLVDTNDINDNAEESDDLVNIKEGENLFEDKQKENIGDLSKQYIELAYAIKELEMLSDIISDRYRYKDHIYRFHDYLYDNEYSFYDKYDIKTFIR